MRSFYSPRLADIAFSRTSRLCLLALDPEGSLLVKMDLGGWADFAKPMLAGTAPLQYIPYCTGCPASGKPHQKSGPLAAALLSLLFLSWNPCLESSLGVFTSAGEEGQSLQTLPIRCPESSLNANFLSPLTPSPTPSSQEYKDVCLLWFLLCSDFTLGLLL